MWNLKSSMQVGSNSKRKLAYTEKCIVLHSEKHLPNGNSINNIAALSDVAGKWNVTIDTENEKSLGIHFLNIIAKFR